MVPSVERLLKKRADTVERSLARLLPDRGSARLNDAMRYSTMAGGKRVRPFLVIESAIACGGTESAALPLACAMEMIHTYSLVHDDLPCMDDDKERRGKPTCHIRFGEAEAILAGDALLSHAFHVMAEAKVRPERLQGALRVVADAIGPYGMVAGQSLDMRHQRSTTSLKVMDHINRLKTGCLIRASAEAGALWAGGSPARVRSLRSYGENIGFLFQVVDDIIDGDGCARLASVEAAYRKAARLRDEAKTHLKGFGKNALVLSAFADFLYQRTQ